MRFVMTPFTMTSIYCFKLYFGLFPNIRGSFVMLLIPPRRQVSGKLMVAVYVAAC